MGAKTKVVFRTSLIQKRAGVASPSRSSEVRGRDWERWRDRIVNHDKTRSFQARFIERQFTFICDDEKSGILARSRPVVTDRTAHVSEHLATRFDSLLEKVAHLSKLRKLRRRGVRASAPWVVSEASPMERYPTISSRVRNLAEREEGTVWLFRTPSPTQDMRPAH